MNKEQKDIHQFIKHSEELILLDLDYKKKEELLSSFLTKTQKVINNNLIPEIINHEMADSDEDTKERMRYSLTLEMNQKIEKFPSFYLPSAKLTFNAFERLSIPAIIGSVIFGLLFYYTLGGFFKEELFAPLIGMPLGAGFFVWMFSKAIKHPKITKLIKWSAISGLVVISIGAVFAQLKKRFIFKPGISFIQWIWLAILTFLIFWTLHLFKPRLEENVEETERCLRKQLNLLMYGVYELVVSKIKSFSEYGDKKIHLTKDNPPSKNIFEQSKTIASSIQQMTYAMETQDEEAALLSVNSFLNSLHSAGIHQLEKDKSFAFTNEDVAYYETFGIIREGDLVEQLYSAWVDNQGKCVFKGKVKKVKR